ncbi:MAG: calcium/sodium antiporter [Fimbriimonadaceae bacterium]|nr:calcium/sodium antiporter [Fimbriimonadaceae bacterium]QYK54937.1 MAG: calcium/sodium antiporter [Fimbriimonadaceae bacterium]
MSPPIAVVLVLAGLGLLGVGGELLVRGATTLAKLAGLTPAVIGLTVVAMGTSLPELVVSLTASFQNSPDIAVGNVVGSNIFNVLLILGPTALLCTLPVRGQVVQIEWPFMFFATILAMIAMHDGVVDRFEGTALVVLLVGFTWVMLQRARNEVKRDEEQTLAEEQAAHEAPAKGPPWLAAGLLLGGFLLLVGGGRALVVGSVELARLFGMSERVIGLTVVAFGTSAPELAASLIAARKGHADVAVGNLIGSNIFNLLGILGLSAAILPLKVAREIVDSDMWWMAGSSLLLLPLMVRGRVINRLEGGLLFVCGVVYITLLVLKPT